MAEEEQCQNGMLAIIQVDGIVRQEGEQPSKGSIPEDRKEMRSFYNFTMGQNKLQQIQKRSRRTMIRFAFTGLIFGFFTEWLLGNGKIYDNIIKKTTMRRMNAKKKEDDRIETRIQLKQQQAKGTLLHQ